jgi:hypothetical protein
MNAKGEAAAIVAAMREAASHLLAAIDEPNRERLCWRLDDEDRRSWAYFPRNSPGLQIGSLNADEQKLVHRLVVAGLSYHGYAQVVAVMAQERLIDLDEARRLTAIRDPGRYFVRIFGSPEDDVWGWQYEGHHVSLNVTVGGDALVSATPIFIGSQPAEVRHGEHSVMRICGEEEDAARELLRSLDGKQRSQAVICEEAPPDFVLTNAPHVPDRRVAGEEIPLKPIRERFDEMREEDRRALTFDRRAPSGIAASAMTASQRERLEALLGVYVDRLPAELARIEWTKIRAEGVEGLHFAWAGSDRPREGHYYRVQGPSLLIEYDNTQDGANHIHAVWRDPECDFGRDILAEHYATHSTEVRR